MIAKWIADAAFGPVLDIVKDLGGKWINKQISDKQFETELYKALLLAFTGLWDKQAEVIKAEITGEDKITRIWRPVVALAFAFVLIWFALLAPIFVDWFGAPPLRTSDTLLEHVVTLLTISITGYIGGRSAEKIAQILKGK